MIDLNRNQVERKSVEMNKILNGIKSIDVEKNNRLSVPNLIQSEQNSWNALKIWKNERSQSLDPTVKLGQFDSLENRIISLSELSVDAVVCVENERTIGKWYEHLFFCLHSSRKHVEYSKTDVISIVGKNLLSF